MDPKQLRRQIAADPRVQQLATSRKRGSIPGYVSAAELRSFGYDVPNDWKYTSGGGRIQAGVFEEHDKWDAILGAAGGALLTGGVADIIKNPAQQGTYSGVNAAGVPTDPRYADANVPYPPGGGADFLGTKPSG